MSLDAGSTGFIALPGDVVVPSQKAQEELGLICPRLGEFLANGPVVVETPLRPDYTTRLINGRGEVRDRVNAAWFNRVSRPSRTEKKSACEPAPRTIPQSGEPAVLNEDGQDAFSADPHVQRLFDDGPVTVTRVEVFDESHGRHPSSVATVRSGLGRTARINVAWLKRVERRAAARREVAVASVALQG